MARSTRPSSEATSKYVPWHLLPHANLWHNQFSILPRFSC